MRRDFTALTFLLFVPLLAIGQYVFPLRVSSDRRYFVDQNDSPFFINMDAPWDMPAGLTYADAVRYVDNADSTGFTAIVVRMITKSFTINAPRNAYNVSPFIGAIFQSTLNEPYWKHVDSIIDYCATKNMVVWAAPAYSGYGGPGSNEGFYDETASATTTQMKTYGDSLGRRYASRPNIMWLVGGDCDPTNIKDKLDSMMAGINLHCNFPRSPRNEPETWASTHWNTVSETMSYSFGGFYSYTNTMYTWAANAYNSIPTMPFILQETTYENEHGSSPHTLRAQTWWGILGGAIAGQCFGNCPIWNFSQYGGSFCGITTDWRPHLYDQGRLSMKYLKTTLMTHHWWRLVPDTAHTVADSGYGAATSYCTTARASDSSCIITYMPSQHRIRIKLSYVNGDSAACKWIRASDGLEISMGNLPRRSATFMPPTNTDYVLVIDSFSSPVEPPSPPGLLKPPDGAIGPSSSIEFVWTRAPTATNYDIQISLDSLFASTIYEDSLLADTTHQVTELQRNITYNWRVRAGNAAGRSQWSEVWEFTTAHDTVQRYVMSGGWNMISLPMTVFDATRATLFPNSTSEAFAYERGRGYVPTDTLRTREGYWLKFDSTQEVTIAGIPHFADTVDIDPGWNLIGSVYGSLDTSTVLWIPQGIQLSRFFEYASGYRIASTIDGGKGYWVKSSSTGKLVLSPQMRSKTGSTLPGFPAPSRSRSAPRKIY